MTVPDSSTINSLDLAGAKVGGYQLLRRLGHGGMAVVYLARQEALRRFVAIKILKPGLASDPNYVRRFAREAQAAAALVHPNIVQIFEIGNDAGLHFIVQEYVAGKNVKQLMTQQPALPVTAVVAILSQVGSALGKAADVGIVHRDIKPENILIADDGTVKVADFGLARVSSDRDQMELTHVGMTMGTPMYMSPEQIEGRPLDARSDLYSLGVTAYHMLTGQPPFAGENAITLAMQQLQSEPVPIQRIRPDVPQELARLIHRMMHKDVQQRPADSKEILQVLDRLTIPDGPLPVDADCSGLIRRTAERLEATQRLSRILRGAMKPTAAAGGIAASWPMIAFVSLAFIVGSALAMLRISTDPFSRFQGQIADEIPRLEAMKRLFWIAVDSDSREDWQHMIDQVRPGETLSPIHSDYLRVARQRLASINISQNRPADAIRWLRELTEMDDTERAARAFGFAGLAICYAEQQEFAAAVAAYGQYLPLRTALQNEPLDPVLADRLRALEPTIRNHSSRGTEPAESR